MLNVNFSELLGMKVLIVDDIEDNVVVVERLIRRQGLGTLVAYSGMQALSIAESKQPNLILLDVQMPEMDGFEVIKKLKENPKTKGIPVIFLTARTEHESMMEGFQLGGVDYITKPFNSGEVLNRVRTHLELKHAHDIAIEQNEKLVTLNATKDRFFSIIAHDLKNPITNFRDITRVLSDKFSDIPNEELQEYIESLRYSSQAICVLLENLLDWSRSQRGAIAFTPVEFDFSFLVQNVVEVLHTSAINKNILIDTSYVPDGMRVVADVKMLNTVLRNLVSNAIKFTEQGGKVTVSAKKGEKNTEFTVADTGVGISAMKISKLFKVSENNSTLGTYGEKGTGLGLVLCKEFIDRHSGDIQIESTLGKGTKVTITIPNIEKPEAE
ncbi:MAG: hybrid sensor histidine kinase/response regulator [Candidatus Kapabacteria bacterium]|nr:hybrid sensor histidine kinase/response regulator [Candidatus Kapabacteria bacterium]